MSELKPCPFCGRTKIRASLTWGFASFAMCQECGASGPLEKTAEEADAAWNNRPIEDELRRLHERAKERIGKLMGA